MDDYIKDYMKIAWRFTVIPPIYELLYLKNIDTIDKLLHLFYTEYEQRQIAYPDKLPQKKRSWISFWPMTSPSNGNCLLLNSEDDVEEAYSTSPRYGFLGGEDVIYGYLGRKCLWLPNEEKESQCWHNQMQKYPSEYNPENVKAWMPEEMSDCLLIPRRSPENGERIYMDCFSDCLKYSCQSCSEEGRPNCVVSSYRLRFEKDPNGLMYAILSSAIFKTYCDMWAEADNYLHEWMWNSFPLPQLNSEQEREITELGRKVRRERNRVREDSCNYSLYNLCNPRKTNKKTLNDLIKAYEELDEAINAVFSPMKPLKTEKERQKALLNALRPVHKDILQILNQKMQERANHWQYEAQYWESMTQEPPKRE